MNEQNGYDIEDLHVGMTACFSRTLTEADIIVFAGLSGDNNPVHFNEEYASTTAFRGRVAHGFLVASLISAALSNRLPGPGAIYREQQLRFRAPVCPGDTVHATVTVKQVDLDKAIAVLETVCQVRDRVVIDGEATVQMSSSARRNRMGITSKANTGRLVLQGVEKSLLG